MLRRTAHGPRVVVNLNGIKVNNGMVNTIYARSVNPNVIKVNFRVGMVNRGG